MFQEFSTLLDFMWDHFHFLHCSKKSTKFVNGSFDEDFENMVSL